MNILYDGQIYIDQKAGGISRYFSNLISRLPLDFAPSITYCQEDHLYLPEHARLKKYFYKRFGFKPGRISYWLEPYYFQSVSLFKKFDILHPTYYNLLSQTSLKSHSGATVVTVWDMIHEIFMPDNWIIPYKKDAILSADLVLCISQNTKNDLLERYNLPEERIVVTYLASDGFDANSLHSENASQYPYFLFVGGRGGYKNFKTLLYAFSKIISVQSSLMLYVVGSSFSEVELNLINDLNLSGKIKNFGYVDDVKLATLYRESIAFVYPSLYEGFGIPPLEAMQSGTAVIASNTSSIPEVVGDAGILVDPSSVSDLAESMLFVATHPIERDRLIVKGQARAKEFSWDKTAAQTLEVYRSIAS